MIIYFKSLFQVWIFGILKLPKRGTMILQNYCKLSTIPKRLLYNWPYNNKKEGMEWRPHIIHVIKYFLSCEIIFGEEENFHVYIIQVWHRTLHQDQGRKYIFPSKFKFLVFDLVIFNNNKKGSHRGKKQSCWHYHVEVVVALV